MALLYDRILRHRKIIVNKSDTVWNWAFNMPCKSLKGILILFEEERSYTRDMSKFYNPKIQKVSVIMGGKPNQLYAQGMRSFKQYDKICKYFTEGKQRALCPPPIKLENSPPPIFVDHDKNFFRYFFNLCMTKANLNSITSLRMQLYCLIEILKQQQLKSLK